MTTRILIGSSSHAFGRGLADSLERDGDLSVVAIVADTAATIQAARRLRPEMIALELDLPAAGGVRATQRIMGENPTRIVVIVAHEQRQSSNADAALAAGAVGVIPRSAVDLDAPGSAMGDALRRRFRRLVTARLTAAPGFGPAAAPVAAASPVRATAPVAPAALAAAARRAPRDKRRGLRHAEVVGICASTGGPGALVRALRPLPADFALPVLVVQHMGGGFIDGLVRWLDAELPLPVAVAAAGAPLVPGVHVAPEGAHLVLGSGHRLELDRTTVAGSHRPSGDVLFSSLARVAGAGAVAVVLTGMGRDGAAGLAEVAAAGGQTIAQDESSSAIYGMPRAAAEVGAQRIVALEAIGPLLASLDRNDAR
ncbi:MAG TPA: chemotaxis protein CheB [Solirubrobacteraceae bacterium]|jgi:two-component system chemotaxis response regulator CheB